MHPVLLDDADDDLVCSAEGISRTVREVPHGGAAYGVLRWGADRVVRDRLAAMPAAEVSFVYLGRLDDVLPPGGLLRMFPNDTGASRSRRAPRRRLIEIAASIVDGRLAVDWTWAPHVHDLSTVQRLADETMSLLRAAVDRSQATAPDPIPDEPRGRGRSPIVRLNRSAGRPFFCVHPAGGVAQCYAPLARALPDFRFYGLRGRGLRADEAADVRVEVMAETYVDAVRSVQPTGPYLLGGWSFGGTVAFEMALRLQRAHEDVTLVVLELDSRPPLRRSAALLAEPELRTAFREGTSTLVGGVFRGATAGPAWPRWAGSSRSTPPPSRSCGCCYRQRATPACQLNSPRPIKVTPHRSNRTEPVSSSAATAEPHPPRRHDHP